MSAVQSLNRAKGLLNAAEDQAKKGGGLSRAAVLGSLAATWTPELRVQEEARRPRHLPPPVRDQVRLARELTRESR